jgi:hypothetical protein
MLLDGQPAKTLWPAPAAPGVEIRNHLTSPRQTYKLYIQAAVACRLQLRSCWV